MEYIIKAESLSKVVEGNESGCNPVACPKNISYCSTPTLFCA